MVRFFAAIAVSGSLVNALQIPFIGDVRLQKPISALKKPIINSTSLQNDIHIDNLLARAKKLFKIAELSEDEYNHPTRVIGSEGK